jgi:hypothetical protein
LVAGACFISAKSTTVFAFFAVSCLLIGPVAW